MSTKTKENHDTDEKKTLCLACESELRSFSILVCAECLDEECDEFLKLAQTVDELKK